MNSRRFLLAVALAIAISAKAQDLSAGRIAGTLKSGVYESETLGLTYTLPHDYFLVEEHRKLGLQAAEILLIADKHTDRPLRNRVLIAADGADNYYLSLKDYTTKVVAAMSSQGRELLRSPVEVKYANKLFYRADLRESSPEATAYQAVLMTERREYWIFWNFISSSQAELEEMVATLENLRFQDNADDLSRTPRRTIPVEPGKRVRVLESKSSGMIIERPSVELPTGYRGPNKVVLRVVVTTAGVVNDIAVVSGPPQLTRTAMTAVDRYRYKPLIVNDRLVEMETTVTVIFARAPR